MPLVPPDYRAVAYMDYEAYHLLKQALVLNELTFSEWVRENAQRYVQANLRGPLTLLPSGPPEAHRMGHSP